MRRLRVYNFDYFLPTRNKSNWIEHNERNLSQHVMQLRSQFHNNSLDTFLEVQITSFIHSRRISKLYHTFAIVQTFQLNVLKSTILSNTGSTLSNHVRFLRSLNKSLFPLTPVHHMRPLLSYFFLFIYLYIYWLPPVPTKKTKNSQRWFLNE